MIKNSTLIVQVMLVFCMLFSSIHVFAQTYAKTASIGLRLEVSANKRYLVKEDGTPFFYLGDTAWELFHRLNREEANLYLKDRAEKGFTVIQAVALAELNGHTDPNAYGHLPFVGLDPALPAVHDGPADDYWDHVDYIVDKANELGLYMGFLPTWGKYWHDSKSPLFTVQNAEVYGEWLGNRYRDKDIIWILGGDRTIENDLHRKIIVSMAKGIRRGDGGRNLITFHPRGGEGSAQYFHDEDWLDFNMRQNGHIAEYSGNYGNRLNDKLKDYGQTRIDFNRNPTKPVIDGEPLYEDHPLSFNAKELGHSIASDVRRHLYWNLFNGAFGHTYGHHSIWQMWSKGKNPINSPLMPWQEALNQPGSAQMQYGRKLIESRPFLTRIPDNSIIVTDRVPTSVPGVGRYKFVATRDTEGTYGMVYVPVGRPFRVNMKSIAGEKVRAWWFNPRNGEATEIGIFDNEGTHTFIPPDKGEALDWVLVLDDTTQNYAPPGTSKAASMRKPPDDPPGGALAGEKSRLIVLSDIGTKVDPDDFQSMVHLLLYSNILDIEGLIGSMTWRGDNMEAIEEVIAAYEKDYDRLISHSPDFPTPEYLRSVTKKGATRASNGGYRTEGTQGSDWIIERAHEDDPRPLWISVWGAITDVAQAVYEDPSIKEKIRVFSIGAWNTTQDQDARDYLYNHHSDLYWIESNDSFRGMWAGGDQSGDFSGEAFVKKHIKGHGALGDYYWDHRSAPPVTKNPKWNYYLREGDTPSWLYLVRGDINDPEKEHWGGQYKKTGHGPNYYSDHPNSEYQELIDGKNYKGVKTVNRWRKAYLLELMKRMDWAKKSK